MDPLWRYLRVKGLLPDWWLRFRLRRKLGGRLRQEERSCLERQKQHHMRFVQSLKRGPIAIETRGSKEQYSEVPTAFYQLVLGKRLKYSCGYWPTGTTTLDEAEEEMLRLTCERAQVKDGQHILDLGCGWGSLALYLAQRYPNCKITALSNSATQGHFIEARRAQQALGNLAVVTADINEFRSELLFDRIISVEMFEEMLNFQQLLAKVASWMKEDSLLFVQVYCHSRFAYHREAFAGGLMPSDDLLLYFQDSTRIVDHWRLSGTHYQKTSEAWLQNIARNRHALLPILADHYGARQATVALADWRLYMLACSELFGYGDGQEWAVSHYLSEKRVVVG